MAGLLKFGTKIFILGGTVYYFNQNGVWGSSTTSYELSKRIVAFASPYFNEIQKEIPVQVKNLPSSEDACRTVSGYWNKGVISSVTFVGDIPKNISFYFVQGLNYSANYLQSLQEEKVISPEKGSS